MELAKIQMLLHSFRKEIEHTTNRESIEEALSWIFADTKYSPLIERSINSPFVTSSNTQQDAFPLFNAWSRQHKNVVRLLKKPPHQQRAHSEEFVIPRPKREDSLVEYLVEISQKIAKNNGCKDSFWASLRSFLNYLKQIVPNHEKNVIEALFPDRLETSSECELRIINDPHLAIDKTVCAQIIKNLTSLVVSGPENVQKMAAQALVFSWICLYSAHAHLMPEEKLLHQICKQDLHPASFKIVKADKEYTYHTLKIPSLFGKVEVPIPDLLATLLHLLPYPDSERVFSSPLPALRRVFNRAVKELSEIKGEDRITFSKMANFS